MVKINLLPWREELQKQKQQEFLIALGVALLITGLLFAAGYFYIEGQKTYQQQRNTYLEEEIKILKKKIAEIKDINTKKNKLREKIKVIEDFQANRSEIIHIMDELRKITPKGISLSSVIQKEDKFEFKGFLISNNDADASLLMNAITQSAWLDLDEIGLKIVDGRKRVEPKEGDTTEQIEEKKYNQFIILAKQVKKNKKTEEDEDEDEDEDETEASE
jgi:type IV pilus assembly protein PilN